MNTQLNIDRHPCFNAAVKGECGRVHLPVAPKCNILCNYCNRKYDCVNESRPGVTSAVLRPRQAVTYVEAVLEREPRITVAGIAGPGDPFANPQETLETLCLIRERFPDLLLCLASNGLGLPPHLDELAELKVSHVTITVNAVDPEIGARIYSWVREGKVIYRGRRAAEVLLERQLEAIRGLKARAITVKVNTIVIPGVNDRHVPEVAREMAALGVDMLNCMPVYPNADTPFGELPEPAPEHMAAIRRQAEEHIPQMHHCTRCRADAVGLLTADRAEELRGCLTECAHQVTVAADRPYVAVATQEGVLVNLHLGEAASFQVWGPVDGGFRMIEERPAPLPGGGPDRWWALAEILRDCRALLVSAVGETPRAILEEAGVPPVPMSGFIAAALTTIYAGGDPSSLKGRRGGVAGGCCNKKSGEGCL
jgi:nitrogen fixation protein NifB